MATASTNTTVSFPSACPPPFGDGTRAPLSQHAIIQDQMEQPSQTLGQVPVSGGSNHLAKPLTVAKLRTEHALAKSQVARGTTVRCEKAIAQTQPGGSGAPPLEFCKELTEAEKEVFSDFWFALEQHKNDDAYFFEVVGKWLRGMEIENEKPGWFRAHARNPDVLNFPDLAPRLLGSTDGHTIVWNAYKAFAQAAKTRGVDVTGCRVYRWLTHHHMNSSTTYSPAALLVSWGGRRNLI